MSDWAKFAEQARAGELYLDDETAARECLAACTVFIDEMRSVSQLVDRAKNVAGFGDFQMAEELRQLFLSQATGGDNSMDAATLESITVAEDMRDVMAISIARLCGQDYTNSEAIAAIIEQVGRV